MESRKMVLMNYFQGRNGDTDVENRLADAVGQGESGTNAASSINIYILLCVRQTAGEKLLCSTRSPIWCSVMTWRGKIGAWGKRFKRGDIRIQFSSVLFSCSVVSNSL